MIAKFTTSRNNKDCGSIFLEVWEIQEDETLPISMSEFGNDLSHFQIDLNKIELKKLIEELKYKLKQME